MNKALSILAVATTLLLCLGNTAQATLDIETVLVGDPGKPCRYPGYVH